MRASTSPPSPFTPVCERDLFSGAHTTQAHTYMDYVARGVLIISADKEINQDFLSVLRIQLGNGLLCCPGRTCR